MKKLLALVSLAALLSCEMECFKSLEKDYENIDHMLEFGAQIFLNYLDKVRDIMEKIVRDNQLRTSRIAILDCWKSFKETAKKISVEERGKGVQDDYVVMARTIRRLVLFYKDDVHKIVYSFATENSIEQYLPAVNMFKGVIEKEKLNEILGGMESYYFPGAPSITTDPLDFLCYLLSTNTMETFIVTIVKIGADVTTQMRSIDLEQVYKRLQLSWKKIQDKAIEFETLERQKGKDNDEFLISARAAARVWLFYFDIFLEYMESPEFIQKVKMAETKLQDEKFLNELKEMEQKLHSSVDSDLLKEAAWLYLEFFGEIYKIASYPPLVFLHMMGAQRIPKIYKAFYGISVCSIASILEKLHEMDVFAAIKRLHSRASVISHAIMEGEEFEMFRGRSVEHWKSFKEEAHTLLKKEREKTKIFQLAEIRVMIQLMSKYSRRLFSTISGSITDNEAEHILKNVKKIRDIYTKKLLISGKVAQEELEESQRFLEEKFSDFLELLGLNDGSLWDLYKVAVAFLSSILAPLSYTWNFISE